MKILVLNSGSSSIKYKVFDYNSLKELLNGEEENITEHLQAVKKLVNKLFGSGIISNINEIKAVGHRVVHGGDYFKAPVLINKAAIEKIETLSFLAPLHNPANLAGIKAIQKHLPNTPQVAVFDTSFHTAMPKVAKIYPLPFEYYEKLQIKRYGFHGISHKYLAHKGAEILGKDIKELNFITLHLGGGCSACAVKGGKSIETSMGFTPLEGLMMGSRCGDIDSSIIFYLKKELNLSDSELEEILNKESGFKGIYGTINVKEIEENCLKNDPQAKLAIEMFLHRIYKYIGSYLILLERVDAIIISGGIGEHSKLIKELIEEKIRKFNLKLLQIKTDEELQIAKEIKALL